MKMIIAEFMIGLMCFIMLMVFAQLTNMIPVKKKSALLYWLCTFIVCVWLMGHIAHLLGDMI